MHSPKNIVVSTGDGNTRTITIEPVWVFLPGRGGNAVEAYVLMEGNNIIGDMVFSETFDEWKYQGADLLTPDEQRQIAELIQALEAPGPQ